MKTVTRGLPKGETVTRGLPKGEDCHKRVVRHFNIVLAVYCLHILHSRAFILSQNLEAYRLE